MIEKVENWPRIVANIYILMNMCKQLKIRLSTEYEVDEVVCEKTFQNSFNAF